MYLSIYHNCNYSFYGYLKFIAVSRYYDVSDWSRLRRCDNMKALLKSADAQLPRAHCGESKVSA